MDLMGSFHIFFSGEWHQYDDIICSEPSKNVLNRVIEYVWSEQGKIIKGREIAGEFMLGTIFDLLRSWSKINLSNFFCLLRQFYDVYGNPFVFEKKMMKWVSLNYGEKDVSEAYVSHHIMKTIFSNFQPILTVNICLTDNLICLSPKILWITQEKISSNLTG